MAKYLGSSVVNASDIDVFCNYTPFDWAMYFIENYGGIDGSHHKSWVMDQVARIHKGTEIEIELAKWDDGTEEYRVNLLEPSQEYNDWVLLMQGGVDEDGDYYYDYDAGCAP